MALPHLLVGLWQRRGANLFFVLTTIAVIGIALGELSMMHTQSVEQFVRAQRWMHLAVFGLVVGLVGFVSLYFRTATLWLGLTVCAVRFVALVVNFASPVSLNFREITGLRHLHFLGDEVSAPVGVVSPWTHLGELSSLLMLVYVIDASVRSWRLGTAEGRRRAVVVGGSIILFVLVAAGGSALTHRQIIHVPYLISLPFIAILAATAFELGSDLFRAGQVARELQHSEASLQESEERFRIMANAAPVLLWMSGPDKLCTFFNKSWLDFTGRRMDQEIGVGWTEGVHPADFEKCLEVYETAFDLREPFVMQYRLRRHDGEYRQLTDNGVPRYNVAGDFRGYIGACVDITDLFNQERALREFEERVTLAAETAHLGVWEINTETGAVWMSDKARELFQLDPETPLNHSVIQERVHPDDRARRDSMVQEAVKTHGGYEIEYRILLRDGAVRWIGARARCVRDENGALTRLLAVSMDVTARKRAEENLVQLSQRNELILNSAAEGILGLDLEGNHTFVNPAAARMLGYEPGELIGRPSHSLWHHTKADGTPYPKEQCAIYAAYRDGTVHTLSTEVFWRKDRTSFPVEYSSTPVFDRGRLVGAVVTFMDISERKAAEQEARQRREQIALLSRASLLGEMTASLAHELNQPLSAIVSNANAGMRFIDKGKVDPVELREILADVVADGRRANEIIRNVRSAIKKGSAIRGAINLNDVVRNVAHMVQPDAISHLCEVHTSLAEDLPIIEGDPTQIQQVMVNLVSNAFEAMRDAPPSRRKVEISSERNAEGAICVSVRDHGPGIPETVHGRLFEHFFTTKDEGLGMGLAIVRSIVEAHGGKIEAENADGGGARFYFLLPAAKNNNTV